MKTKLYFAAPLFSQAERSFNEMTAAELELQFDVFLPQKDGGLLLDIVATGVSIERAKRLVFEKDIEALRAAELVLIVLDGRAIDEGAAFELGFACALGKRCIALQTDVRRLLPSGNNPMLDGALERTFADVGALLHWYGDQTSTSTGAI